jgi:hypothetical protein
MGEIKISVSDKLEEIIQKIADNLGIKKTEFVKSLVISNVLDIEKEKGGKK